MAARIVLIAILHTLVLFAILADRAYTLETGREAVLRTEPIDPRDLFRGDYVILGYAIHRLSLNALAGEDDFSQADAIYVALAPQEGLHVPVAVYTALPKEGTLPADQVVLRGRITYVDVRTPQPNDPAAEAACPAPCTVVMADYGIESYFVPEGQGRRLEEARNEARLDIVVSVQPSGRAAIKAIRLDGVVVSREGLF